MSSSPQSPKRNPDEPILMDHEYDGIREYDQKLPNWWLVTLFGAIIFSAVYWFYYVQSNVGKDDRVIVSAEIAEIEAKKLAASGKIDDETLIKMSENATIRATGEATFKAACATCHGDDGKGKKGSGFNLMDATWVHGAKPKQIFDNINNGIKYKGQQTGMVSRGELGPQKIAEVVAFIISHNKIEEMKTIAREDEPSQK